MTPPNKLTVEEIESWLSATGTHLNSYDAKRALRQLADMMRDNERLLDSLKDAAAALEIDYPMTHRNIVSALQQHKESGI